jgi:hypothetical protein
MFKSFLEKIKTEENAHLIEAIESGYNACMEAEITREGMADILHGIDLLDKDLTPKTNPPIYDHEFKPEWHLCEEMEDHHKKILKILQTKIDEFKTDILEHYNINDIAELSDSKLKGVSNALNALYNELDHVKGEFEYTEKNPHKIKEMDHFVDTNQEVIDDIYDIAMDRV